MWIGRLSAVASVGCRYKDSARDSEKRQRRERYRNPQVRREQALPIMLGDLRLLKQLPVPAVFRVACRLGCRRSGLNVQQGLVIVMLYGATCCKLDGTMPVGANTPGKRHGGQHGARHKHKHHQQRHKALPSQGVSDRT